MIPMEPANEVKIVRAFFIFKLLKLSDKAVKKDIDDLPIFSCLGVSNSFSFTIYSLESERITPSRNSTILVAYSLANSGL